MYWQNLQNISKSQSNHSLQLVTMARYLHACYSVPNQARIQVDKAHCIHGLVLSCVYWNSKLSGDSLIEQQTV